jgi:Icc-related predicted phosphoesterase
MKALIFSDIHGDLRALARLMDTEADYYVAAGDLVNFGRGLDRCGEILARRLNPETGRAVAACPATPHSRKSPSHRRRPERLRR